MLVLIVHKKCSPSPPPPAGAYLKNTGEFTVRYVLQNRLLEGDGTISKIRKVQVIDVDECTYTGPHVEVRRVMPLIGARRWQ